MCSALELVSHFSSIALYTKTMMSIEVTETLQRVYPSILARKRVSRCNISVTSPHTQSIESHDVTNRLVAAGMHAK